MPIPYTKHQIATKDIEAVIDALLSGTLVDGDLVREFESKISELTNSSYSVAVNSGTSGLHIAYLAMGIGPQSLVWTVPNTFVATANAARLCGAEVDFVDIDPFTYAISTTALEDKLFTARANGRPLPDLVVPVHFAGAPVDMARIGELASEYGFSVVEDAAHALGAKANGSPVGGCSYSAISVFSTHPAKIITTGEGGVCTTNSQELAYRMRLLRSHGVDKAGCNSTQPYLYEQHLLGLNYRLTEMAAALGLSQLHRLPQLARSRREIVARYKDAMKDLGIESQTHNVGAESSNHLYVIQLNGKQERDKVFRSLFENDIQAQVHYRPVHTQPYYRQLGFTPGDFPVSEQYFSRAISLPVFPDLTEEEQGRVVTTITRELEKACTRSQSL